MKSYLTVGKIAVGKTRVGEMGVGEMGTSPLNYSCSDILTSHSRNKKIYIVACLFLKNI